MSIKINVNGIELVVSNAAEAAALLREINAVPKNLLGGGKPMPPPVFNGSRAANGVDKGFDAKAAAIDLLEAVRGAGPQGLAREKAMPILHAEHPKGVGARMAVINKLFTDKGIDPEKVFETTRSLERGRIWHPGKQLTEALEKLNR